MYDVSLHCRACVGGDVLRYPTVYVIWCHNVLVYINLNRKPNKRIILSLCSSIAFRVLTLQFLMRYFWHYPKIFSQICEYFWRRKFPKDNFKLKYQLVLDLQAFWKTHFFVKNCTKRHFCEPLMFLSITGEKQIKVKLGNREDMRKNPRDTAVFRG